MFIGVRDQGGEDPNTEKEHYLPKEECETCAVCKTKVNSSAPPKLLPCLHPVCKACFTNSNDGNTKECPVCGLSFNLSEVTDCFMFVDSAPKCGGCDESMLSGWCVQCEEALCSQCVSAHQRVKVTRNHTVTPQDPSSGSTVSLRCASHKQEWLKFLCITCNELTCRDCQLILHRGHSFLLLEEAMVSLREQLQKMLHSIQEQRNRMKESLVNMDGRLQDIKALKVASKKKLIDFVRNMYMCLVFRGSELFKEVEGLYDEEEKNLLEIKNCLRKLEERQDYVTAFIHKILRTDSQCILLHKKQIEKQVDGLLSQKTSLSETMIRPTLQLSSEFCQILKSFGSIKVQRVPFESRRRFWNSNKSKEAPIVEDSGPSGIISKPVSVPIVQRPSHLLMASNPVLPVAPGENHSSTSCVPAHRSPVIPLQSTTAQSASTQESPSLPRYAWSHPVSTQLLQSTQNFRMHPNLPSVLNHVSTSSLPSQTVLSTFPSHPSQDGTALPPAKLAPSPQVRSGPAAVSLGLTPHHATTQRSISLHDTKFPLRGSVASQLFNLNQTRSHSAPSLSTPAPAQPSQAASVPQPSNVKVLSDCWQGSVHPIQSASVRSLSQSCQSNSHIPSASNIRTLPLTQTSSSTLPDKLRPSDSIVAQSHPLLFTLLKEPDTSTSFKFRRNWKFHHYTPGAAINQVSGVTCDPNCALLLTMPPSNPGIAATSTSTEANGLPAFGETTTSSQPMSSTDFAVISNTQATPTVPITCILNATETPNASSNQSQSEQVTQTSKMTMSEVPVKAPAETNCEVLVKAPADSLGEGSVIVGGRASPADDDPDGNLPTSTVPETDPGVAPAFSPLPDPSFIVQDCPFTQSSLSSSKMSFKSLIISTPSENTSKSKSQTLCSPVSFRQLLEESVSPTSLLDGHHNVLPRPETEWASPPSMKEEEEEEETDISDSEPLEHEVVYEVVNSEGTSKLPETTTKSLRVSLSRLPISVPPSGSPLPQFRIAASVQPSELLLKELEDGQPTQRCFRIPAVPQVMSALPSPSSGCPLLDEVLDCSVCLCSGALLLCAECGRSFHSECHVPPVYKPTEFWMCSLCHNVLDDTDPFSQSRLKEPYLSIQDQRRCEQLLLTLMCEQHSYLLNRRIKSRKYMGFQFIVGRLLGKQSPPYRSAAELVSDVWALFDILSSISKKRDMVIKLQRSFQERLNITFGESLHASLLKPPSSEDQKGEPESVINRTKAKSTLKRMKAFFAANCSSKKPRIEGANKD